MKRFLIFITLFLGVCVSSYYVARAQTGITTFQVDQNFVNNVNTAIAKINSWPIQPPGTMISNINLNGYGFTGNGSFTGTTTTASVNRVLNVTASPYNAKCDGVTDDTAAFTSAITALPNGGTIFIPQSANQCKITSALAVSEPVTFMFDHSGIIYSGTGIAAGLFQFDSGATGSAVVCKGDAAYNCHITVTPSTTGTPIFATASGSVSIDNLHFAGLWITVMNEVTDVFQVNATGSRHDVMDNIVVDNSGTAATGALADFTAAGAGGDVNNFRLSNTIVKNLSLTTGFIQLNPGQMVNATIFNNEWVGLVKIMNVDYLDNATIFSNNWLDSVPAASSCGISVGSHSAGFTYIDNQTEQPNQLNNSGVDELCFTSVVTGLVTNNQFSGDTIAHTNNAAAAIKFADSGSNAVQVSGNKAGAGTGYFIDDSGGSPVVAPNNSFPSMTNNDPGTNIYSISDNAATIRFAQKTGVFTTKYPGDTYARYQFNPGAGFQIGAGTGAPTTVIDEAKNITATSVTAPLLNQTPVAVGSLPGTCTAGDHRTVSDWNGTNGACTGSGTDYTIATCGASNNWFCP